MASATIDEITVSGEPESWAALGFTVADGVCRLGAVQLRFTGSRADPDQGILGWALRDIASDALDGLPTTVSRAAIGDRAEEHPNGVLAIDHVVAMSADLQRTVEALTAAGLDLRRIREEPTAAGAPRQAFFRLGGEILEVVQEPQEVVERGGGPDRPTRFWGLALLVADLDASAAVFAPQLGTIRPAVQPGRRIATVKRTAALSVPVALIDSAPRA